MKNSPTSDAALLNSIAQDFETVKTVKTVNNVAFLNAIFGENLAQAFPGVVSLPGDPGTFKGWHAHPWPGDNQKLPASRNNYFTVARFEPAPDGTFRRKKDLCRFVHGFMLDDVGTRTPLDRISLKPTWRIETSPGNFQVGFALVEPLDDIALADRVQNAIIAAGLCDPGAGGIAARLCRLPVAINGKQKYRDSDGKSWQCRLDIWNPDTRYTIDEIVAGLELELKEIDRPKRKTTVKVIDEDAVHIARSDENPVVTKLIEAGLYKQPNGNGWHAITCPWVNEHTDALDSGSDYHEPTESYPIGGFKCHHGHCSHRRVGDLLNFLEIPRTVAKHKPTIRLHAGELPKIVEAAEIELAGTSRHYQRGGQIVTVITDPSSRETVVTPLTLPSLIRSLAGVAIWVRYDKRAEDWLVTDPPEKYARVLHDATEYPTLPVLNGIARQPYLRADGTLMSLAGYDKASGMFGAFNVRHFNINPAPTRFEAVGALAELKALLDEFAFKTEHDRSTALCAILTAAIRPSLPKAPLFHVSAPDYGSGKSYLCELIGAIASPQTHSSVAFPKDDEECAKMLLAEFMKAPAVIEFDNLTTDIIPHKTLCTALTEEYITGRILGQSKTSKVSTRTLFLSSGNNVEPTRDMVRRTVTITLDPMIENPATRAFKKQPVDEVKAHRGRFVSLAMTIVRGWIEAGKPRAEVRPVNSFNIWADYCRQSLLWLGEADPCASMFEAMAHDPERETLRNLLTAWHERHGDSAHTVAEVLKALTFDDDLCEVIRDIAAERDGRINTRRFGWWLKKHENRVVDGMRFVSRGNSRGRVEWAVVTVLTVSTVLKSFRQDFSNDTDDFSDIVPPVGDAVA